MSDKLIMEFEFFQVPNEIFDLNIMVEATKRVKKRGMREKQLIIRELSSTEKLVYICLCRYANSNKGIFPSYAKIAKNCNIGRQTAIDAIDVLIKNNLLRKQLRFNNSNIYELLKPKKDNKLPGMPSIPPSTPGIPPSTPGIPPSTPGIPPSTPGIPPSTPGVPKKEQLKKNNLKRTTKEEQLKKESDSSYSEIYNLFVSCGFGTLNKILVDMLNDDIEKYSAEWVKEAIKESMKRNKRTLGYVEGILKRWMADGGINVGGSSKNTTTSESTEKKYSEYKFAGENTETEPIPDVDF